MSTAVDLSLRSVATTWVNSRLARAARKVTETAPSIHFDEFPREVPKRDIQISEAAQRLANALHLHLD